MENTTEKVLRTVKTLLSSKDQPVARALLHECINTDPSNLAYYRALIDVESSVGDGALTKRIYAELIKQARRPYSDDNYQDMANWYQLMYQDRDYDRLLTHFEGIWESIPKLSLVTQPCQRVWLYALKAALRGRHLGVFERLSESLSQLRKKCPDFYLIMGVYYLQTQRTAQACELADEGYRLYGDDAQLLMLLAMAGYAQGDMAKSHRHFTRAKELGSPLALSYLIQISTE